MGFKDFTFGLVFKVSVRFPKGTNPFWSSPAGSGPGIGAALGAVVVGVGMIVAVQCGYRMVAGGLLNEMDAWMGRADIGIRSRRFSLLTQQQKKRIEKTPGVRSVVGQLETRLRLQSATKTDWVRVVGIEPPAPGVVRPGQLVAGRSLVPKETSNLVIDEDTARRNQLRIGSTVKLGPPRRQRNYCVAGVFQRPHMDLFNSRMIVMPLHEAQYLSRNTARFTQLKISVTSPDRIDDLARSLAEKLGPTVNVVTRKGRLELIRRNLRLLGFAVEMTGVLVLTVAALILYSALNMGLMRRIAQLGRLRCLGMTRLQMGWLVIGRVLRLGLVGTILGAALGIGAAMVLTKLASTYQGQVSETNIDMISFLSAAWPGIVGGLIVVLAGAAGPTLQAMRVSPLSASRPRANAGSGRLWKIVSWPAGQILGRLIRVPPALLVQYLHWGRWQTTGGIAALAVSLTLFAGLRIAADSLRKTWQLPRKFPDAVAYSASNLIPAQLEPVRKIPGVRSLSGVTALPVRLVKDKGWLAPNVLLVAVEPDGLRKMVGMTFLRGDEASAFSALAAGGAAIIPESFRNRYHLDLGKSLQLKDARGGKVAFRIAGVVESPHLTAAAAFFDMQGQFDQAAEAVIFINRKDLARHYYIRTVNLIMLDLTPGAPDDEALLERLSAALGRRELLFASTREIRRQMELGFDRAVQLTWPVAVLALLLAAVGVTQTFHGAAAAARKHQLALLRAIGLTFGQTVRLVLSEAFLTALLGTAAGFALTMLILRYWQGLLLEAMDIRMPLEPDLPLTLGLSLCVIFLCLFAAWTSIRTYGRRS